MPYKCNRCGRALYEDEACFCTSPVASRCSDAESESPSPRRQDANNVMEIATVQTLCDDIVQMFEEEMPWNLRQAEAAIAVRLLKDVMQKKLHQSMDQD